MSLIRINAFLASAGLGSRRSVEELIQHGKVQVNREIVRDLAFRVDPAKDVVVYKGKPVRCLNFRYIMLYKPVGFTCSKSDRHAEKIIYDLLSRDLHHLSHVGRLDVDSEGLLLMSNDGTWVNRVAHPRSRIGKIYEVEVTGVPTEADMSKAVAGFRHRGELLKIQSYRLLGARERSSRWELVLNQGKKREIRRIYGVLGFKVLNLKRVAIGKLQLGKMKPGQYRDLTEVEKEMVLSSN